MLTQRRAVAAAGLIALATLVWHVTTVRPGHNWGDDFSMYIMHAANIAGGRSYADTPFIHNPAYLTYAPPTYPPVFPVLLAPVYRVRGLDLSALKLVGIVCFALSLVVIALAVRSRIPPRYLVALIAIVAAHPLFWRLKDNVVSEAPFLLFAWTGILLIERTPATSRRLAADIATGLLIGGVVYLAYGTRSIGAVLVPCWLAYDVLRARRLTRAAVIGTAVFVAGALLQSSLLHSDRSYLEMYSARVVLSNAVGYLLSLRVLLDNGVTSPVQTALAVLGGVMALDGFVRQLRCGPTVSELFLITYIAAVLPFVGYAGVRYLIPIIPLLALYILMSLQALIAAAGRPGRLVAVGLACALTLIYVRMYVVQDFGPIRDGIAAADTQQFFDYVRRQTSAGDVFVSPRPRLLALFTGRRGTVHMPPETPDAQVWEHLRRVGATYVVTGPHHRPRWEAFVEAARAAGRVVETFSSGRFRVYKVVR